jgi:AcrR family transcriptional regulator
MKEIKVKVEDARIKRSKLKLRKSLLNLMIDRPVSHITVQELCLNAHVNRTTFYKYYKNVDDLLDEVERNIIGEFREIAAQSLLDENPDTFVHTCLELVEKNHDMARVIFASGKYGLVRDIFALFHDQCVRYWHRVLDCDDLRTLDLIYYFVANGIIGIISRRTDGIIRGSTEELNAFINKISNDGINAFLKQTNDTTKTA